MPKNDGSVLTPDVLNEIDVFSGKPQPQDASPQQIVQQGGAMQQVKAPYTTAVSVQKPRSLTQVVNRVVEEAGLAGQNFYYGWNVKLKSGQTQRIEGPSIDLAMCLSRNFGNCAVDVDCTETPTHYLFTGTFIDLETGFTLPRMFRQRKSQRMGGKMDAERQEDIVFQIGQSKAQRNAVVKAMPGWLVLKAIAVAKDSAKRSIVNLAESRAQVTKFFKDKYGISIDRMENVVGREVDMWTEDDIVNLRATYTAITENRISAQDAFPEIEKESEKDENGKTESKAETQETKDTPEPENDETGQDDDEPKISYKGKLMVAKKNDPELFKTACLDFGTDSMAIPKKKSDREKLYEIYLNLRDVREQGVI